MPPGTDKPGSANVRTAVADVEVSAGAVRGV